MKLTKIEDLKPAEYNPRRIAQEAMHGLKRSVREFGDISGIVWNSKTGHLVAGHQRMNALRALYGDNLLLDAVVPCIVTPTGERFGIRVVEWDVPMEKAANVAANNPLIAGEFTDGLIDVIEEIKEELPEIVDDLRFGEMAGIPAGADGDIDLADGEIAEKESMVKITIMVPKAKALLARNEARSMAHSFGGVVME